MKKIVLFLLLVVVLVACAEKKEAAAPADEYAGLTESQYDAISPEGEASGKQTIYVYRNDAGRIEKVKIEEIISAINLNITAKANVEYSGEEPIKISGNYNAGGKDTPFELTNASQVKGMITAIESQQYVPLPR